MRLKSAQLINQTRATFTQLSSGMAVSTLNRILLDAQEGNFIYFAKYFDTFYVRDGARPSDEMVFELFRYLADDSDVADLYIAEFNKIVGEVVGISDTQEFTKDFHRPLIDDSVALDSFSAHVSRPVRDEFSLAEDAAALHPNKVVVEVTYLADGIDSFAVGKVLQDDLFPLDVLQYDFAKTLSDAYAASDAPSLEPGKVLADSISGIGDYVFISSNKAPGDAFGAADQINTFAVGKALTDTSAAADQINTFGVGKALTDQPSAFDSITSFSTEKELQDSLFVTDDVDGEASILDDQEMQFVKQRTDTAFIGDSIYIQRDYIRAFFETAAAADTALFSVGKTLSDGSSTSDATYMVTGKQLYDIPVATETLSLAFTSTRTDSALIGDATVVSPNKVLLDLASTADAGSLRSQGYADFTYFGEDFVGASRTF